MIPKKEYPFFMKSKKKIFIESPCFGFGPISTSISLAEQLNSKYDIWFITFGEALMFLQKCANYPYVELDTRVETEYDKIKDITQPSDLFITNTNVEFSTYLISNGYKVIIIDTLYWMWNSLPEVYSKHKYFVVQKYFSKNLKNPPKPNECKPIINYSTWTDKISTNKKTALISFGGMSEPGDNMYIISSAEKMIECIIDVLPRDITDVYIVGGLFGEQEIDYKNSRVHILGSIDAKAFYRIARQSKYTFLSPGLTSLYEMIYSKLPFCLLPGLNVSQVYQIYQFKKEFGYEFCIQWPDAKRLTEHFSSVSELDGIDYLRDYIGSIDIKKELRFQKTIEKFIEAVDSDNCFTCQNIAEELFKYPAVEDYIVKFIEEIENE